MFSDLITELRAIYQMAEANNKLEALDKATLLWDWIENNISPDDMQEVSKMNESLKEHIMNGMR